ncbi:hypothetical protein OAV19_00490 [bacterium]|nr:hypothetical protein [bacterium]
MLTAEITDARSGELRGLHPRNLNLLRNEMHIVEQLVEVRGELKVLSPKTKASVRRLALPRFLIAELERQLAERSTTELVFPTPTGDPIRVHYDLEAREVVHVPTRGRKVLGDITEHRPRIGVRNDLRRLGYKELLFEVPLEST